MMSQMQGRMIDKEMYMGGKYLELSELYMLLTLMLKNQDSIGN